MKQIPIRFISPDKSKNEFFAVLRQRVDAYFRTNKISKHYNAQMVIKTVVLLLSYIVPFICLMVFQFPIWQSYLIWFFMGLALAGIGMSVMHDANHGAYSSSHKANYFLGHTINLLGGTVFNWKLQHNILHHTYTNITGVDEDIDDKLLMRFSPHNRLKWVHKFQFIYAFFFYGILTLYWVFVKDFVQYVQYTKDETSAKKRKENRISLVKILASKLVYFALFFGLPLLVLKMPVLPYVTGYLIMQFVSGFVLSVIFQLAHTVEETSHPMPDENGTIENTWAIHQLNTTVNFSRKSKLISWYVGGLNFQVEHHLFPTICHVHYPAIAHIVKDTANEFGIPYLENKTFSSALSSHVRALRKFGRLPSLKNLVG